MFLEKKNLRLIAYLPFILLGIGIPWFLFCIFLQYFSFEVWDEKSEYIENIGYLGSFVSGATALVIVCLTGLAVYFSNKAHKQEIERVQQQRFEDHFFHLLEIHRENVKMMEIEHKSFDFRLSENGSYQSKKAILKMFRELMQMIKIIRKEAGNFEELSSSNMRANLVYICFYYGFGGRSGNILEKILVVIKFDVLSTYLSCLDCIAVKTYARQLHDFPSSSKSLMFSV